MLLCVKYPECALRKSAENLEVPQNRQGHSDTFFKGGSTLGFTNPSLPLNKPGKEGCARGHVRLCRDGATAARLVVCCRRVRGPLHVDELDVWKRRRRSLMMEGSLRARFVNALLPPPTPGRGDEVFLNSGSSGVLCMCRRHAETVSNSKR